jgi:CBS domain-containing protein
VDSLRGAPLIPASVPATASFGDAARALAGARLPAVAVLDERLCVVGLFTQDDLVAGLFPRYLRELTHTAFARDDQAALARRALEAGAEPVLQHVSKPVTVELETSATHAAERFLHVPHGAIAVTENERFAGMLRQSDFAAWLLEELELHARDRE